MFAIQKPCPEASFWQGLCRIRQNDSDAAIAALTTAFEQAGKQFIDPALYLGMVLHRLGKPAEGLRYLSEANRVDGNCPFVTLQMGMSLVAAGGDMGLAVRALQRALGPRGFGLWAQSPERAWVEAFPEAKSYVRRLAAKNPYPCPILGNDLAAIARLGRIAAGPGALQAGQFSGGGRPLRQAAARDAADGAAAARLRSGAGPARQIRSGVQASAHGAGAGGAERRVHGRLSGVVRRDGQADAGGGQAEEHRLGDQAARPASR